MITFKDATNREEWDNYIKSYPESNFLQSWDFYEFHSSRGKSVVRRLGVTEKGEPVSAYAGVVETAKRGRHLAVAGGPLLDWSNKKLATSTINDLKSEGKKHNCVFVRIRPQLPLSELSCALKTPSTPVTISPASPISVQNPLKLMTSLGLKKSPMFLSVEYAGILDLTLSEEEILKNASQGFRRKLRKAKKENITLETSTDPSIVHTFYELEVKHAARQGFVPFSESYLKKQFSAFSKNNEVKMYIAKLNGEILAMNFMIFYGAECSYHYGVSSDLGTKYSAAPLLHLAAMEDARKRGITRYNLWGIVGRNETSHRFYGVSEFKRSFGCLELKYTPAHDLILKPAAYKITYLIETARKKLRHLS